MKRFTFWVADAGVAIVSIAAWSGVTRRFPNSAPARLYRLVFNAGSPTA